MTKTPEPPLESSQAIASWVKQRAQELGFNACQITDTDLGEHETHLLNWLAKGFHGDMGYMERHGTNRSRPQDLVPGTVSIISVRMEYFPERAQNADEVLKDPSLGYVSRYALGRDYHKLMRQRLQKLATDLQSRIGDFGYRAFTDSAPVLEKGSWFFLGELFTDLKLPLDPPQETMHCGSCTACIDACPTKAIVAPMKVDARRCISYLTIENDGPIPTEFREAMGNRIYGCDDCQLVCPFNKFSSPTNETDFESRHELDRSTLVSLFSWSESEFNDRLAGSAIRRIGYRNWRRNIAVALGNAATSKAVVNSLQQGRLHADPLLSEHIDWALSRHS